LIGSESDELVLKASALKLANSAIVGHKVFYAQGNLPHSSLPGAPIDGRYWHYYCDYYNPCRQSGIGCSECQYGYDFGSWNYNAYAKSPIEVAAWGNYYGSGR
jgi:hypothetical protein